MIRRRFVNLVLDTYIGRRYAYALHRINVSSLFNPRKPKTPKGEGTTKDVNITRMMEDARLPRPAVTFYPSSIYAECMSLGSRNPDHMVTINEHGRGMVYDVASRSFHILPTLLGPIYESISLTVGGSFYMMKSSHSHLENRLFEVLTYGCRSDFFDISEVWYWRSLPMPPFFLTRPLGDRNGRWSYDEDYQCLDKDARPRVTAYTAVNDSEIWVSFGGETYSFDTVSSEWTKLGDWMLPFEGRAEYSAEHKTWFGLSSSNARLLSTSDLLQSCGTSRAPPQLCNVWKELAMSEEWNLCSSCLLPLGSGRFCIAKVFETGQASNNEYDERFLLLTGVEVERCGKGGNGGRTAELRLVKHRTCRYNLTAIPYIRIF